MEDEVLEKELEEELEGVLKKLEEEQSVPDLHPVSIYQLACSRNKKCSSCDLIFEDVEYQGKLVIDSYDGNHTTTCYLIYYSFAKEEFECKAKDACLTVHNPKVSIAKGTPLVYLCGEDADEDAEELSCSECMYKYHEERLGRCSVWLIDKAALVDDQNKHHYNTRHPHDNPKLINWNTRDIKCTFCNSHTEKLEFYNELPVVVGGVNCLYYYKYISKNIRVLLGMPNNYEGDYLRPHGIAAKLVPLVGMFARGDTYYCIVCLPKIISPAVISSFTDRFILFNPKIGHCNLVCPKPPPPLIKCATEETTELSKDEMEIDSSLEKKPESEGTVEGFKTEKSEKQSTSKEAINADKIYYINLKQHIGNLACETVRVMKATTEINTMPSAGHSASGASISTSSKSATAATTSDQFDKSYGTIYSPDYSEGTAADALPDSTSVRSADVSETASVCKCLGACSCANKCTRKN